MKASKFIVLVGGLLGILAFFLPMASRSETVGGQKTNVSISAFQAVRGIDAVKATINDKDVSKAVAEIGNSKEFAAAKSDANSKLSEAKGIIIGLFVPAMLLLVIGGLAVKRQKFGRLGGTFSLLLGLVGLGIGAVLKGALEGDAGIALTPMIVTGVAGILGGILALAKPERGLATA